MAQVSPRRVRMMRELQDWHAEWARKWGIDDHYYEGESVDDWEARLSPEAEADLRQRTEQIMAKYRRAAEEASAAAGATATPRVLPAPRSREEAVFYMNEHPCPNCGQFRVDWSASLVEIDGVLARRYAGDCRVCRQPREFVFQLADQVAVRPADVTVWYGGDDPSKLIDAGQWLAISEQAAQFARAARDRGDTAGAARDAALAIAFVIEARKFVPPGAEAVPESAFWTAVGQRLYTADPRRFTRRRFNILLDMLREEFPEVSR